jgi:hypothetical protein
MPHSKENKIEDFAFDYLKTYYESQQGAKNIFVGRSELNKYGVEVEGLFAFRQPDCALFLGSVTFNNSQKIGTLLTNYKKEGTGKIRFITPLIFLLLGLFISVTINNDLYVWSFFIISAVGAFVLHTYLAKAYLQLHLEAMIEEMKKYKANEQWLGLSVSSLVFRNNSLANYFLKLCQKRGIGLITVGKRAKVSLLQEPRTHVCHHGDFISHYVSEDNIRKAIQVDTILRVA